MHIQRNDTVELRHLRYFVAVAEEGSFRRAGEERVFVSQPALSRQIQRLEDELGARLFDRTGRGVNLTRAGKALLEEARRMLRQAKRAKETVRLAAEGKSGKLRVGFVGTAAFAVLQPLFRRWRREAPGVELVLSEQPSARQVEALGSEEIDVGFVRIPAPEEGLSFQTVLREPFVAALPASHALAERGEVAVSALAEEDFILFPRQLGAGLFDQVTGICREAGFSPHVAQEAVLMQTIVSLVAAGLGVSILPASTGKLGLEGVQYVWLKEADVETEIAAAWRSEDENPALRRFLNVSKAATEA